MLQSLLFVAIVSQQSVEAPPILDGTESVTILATDTQFASHGPCRRIEYTAPFSGTLHLWASLDGEGLTPPRAAAVRDGDPSRASKLDLVLRIEDAHGLEMAREEDDGSTTPYACLDVEQGVHLMFVLAARGDLPAAFQLHWAAAPETPATDTLGAESEAMVAEIESLCTGDPAMARRRLARAVERLGAAEGSGQSEIANDLRHALIQAATRLDDGATVEALVRPLLAHQLRTKPSTRADVQTTRVLLARTELSRGRCEEARSLCESALAALEGAAERDAIMRIDAQYLFARALVAPACAPTPEDKGRALQLSTHVIQHADVSQTPQRALALEASNLAASIYLDLQQCDSARALCESVLQREITSGDDPRSLLRTRQLLGSAMRYTGNNQRALSLLRDVESELQARQLSDPDLLDDLRMEQAAALYTLGDTQGAHALFAQVERSRTNSQRDNDQRLKNARAWTRKTSPLRADRFGDLDEELTNIRQQAANPKSNALTVQANRIDIGERLRLADRLEESQELLEAAYAACADPAWRYLSMRSRSQLALSFVLRDLAEFARAEKVASEALADLATRFPLEHPEAQDCRKNLLLVSFARESDKFAPKTRTDAERAESAALRKRWMSDLLQGQLSAARTALLSSSSREAEERCVLVSQTVDLALSVASGFDTGQPTRELDPAIFELSETTRGAAIAAGTLKRTGTMSKIAAETYVQWAKVSDEMARLPNRRDATRADFDDARRRYDALQAELRELRAADGGLEPGAAKFTLTALRKHIESDQAVIAYRRYFRFSVTSRDRKGVKVPEYKQQDHICAFVVTPKDLYFVDLGPTESMRVDVANWRHAVGADRDRGMTSVSDADQLSRPLGQSLRLRMFDKLVPLLGKDARRLIVVMDDTLHGIPLDALPSQEDEGFVGDEWKAIERRATLGELLDTRTPIAAGTLVALGGANFAAESAEVTSTSERTTSLNSIKTQFAPLDGSRKEAAAVASMFDARGGTLHAILLTDNNASIARLKARAPGARILHIATHGWTLPDSPRTWNDARALDDVEPVHLRNPDDEPLRGSNPMLLCGLALAHANSAPGTDGSDPGLLTGQELSTFDLADCDLAVLSACSTSLGSRRDGQAVASLQCALQVAGARSAITSLWDVPDESTRLLMTEFYKALWQQGMNKATALWLAKKALRERQNSNNLRYQTRDWAGWVLTGDPN